VTPTRFGRLPALAIGIAVIVGGYFFLTRPSRSADPSSSVGTPIPLSSPRSTGPSPAAAFGRPMAVIDLNSASLAELETLPSITPEYAQKIIAGRPYVAMSDVERAGIPRQVLEQISPPAIIRVIGRGPLPGSPPPGRKP